MRVSETIENVLGSNIEARSNDKILMLAVGERYGLILNEHQRQTFMKMPSFETIRRVRQKLQENGLYKASDEVRRQRKFKGIRNQQMMPQSKPEKIEGLVNNKLFNLPDKKRWY